MQQIGNIRQFWLGIVFSVIGLIALWELPRPIGSIRSMGPGYFPMLLGIGLILIGVASMVVSIRSRHHTHVEPLSLVPTFFIISGIVAMALLIDNAGLAVSLFFMVVGTCYNRVLKHPLEVVVIYLAVLALTWVVFIYLIQLPIKLF